MQKKRLLIIGGSLFAALVVALLVIPSFIDWSRYQSLAQEKLRAATGYDLRIGGTFRIGLIPMPHATVTDVVVTKPVQGKSDTFLTLENADVRVALLPLLAGRVEIASVTLEKPILTLVTYPDGTDNWKPVEQPAQVDAVTGEPVVAPAAAEGKGAPVSVDNVRIKGGRITLRDMAAGTAHTILLDDVSVKADTLSGPFDGDGTVGYNNATFDVSVTTGGYRKGETLPVQLAMKDKAGRADIKWSGVFDTARTEAQGELGLGFTDLGALLADMGLPAAMPDLGGKTQLSGMLTASPDRVLLTNGVLQMGKTKFNARVDASGLKGEAQNIVAIFETGDILDMDELVKVADKAVAESKKAAEKAAKDEGKAPSPAAKAGVAPFLPEDFVLPDATKVDVKFAAKGLRYNRQTTGPIAMTVTAADGKGDARATIDELPGGGNISLSAALTGKGAADGAVIASVSSLKTVLASGLDLVDADVFDQQGVPRRVDADGTFTLKGHTAAATFETLSLGETKLTGTVSYTRAAHPVVNAKLNANLLTLAGAKATPAADKKDAGPAKEGEAAKPADFEFEPPQLPFDLKFDVTLARLNKGDMVMTDVKAAGTYDGKGLSLASGNATVSGGTLSAKGTVADIKAMSGVDVQAGLRTDDLESFVAAMTGKPLELKQKIGPFNGTLKAKGDRKQMAVDVMAQARGFSLAASGTLDDPFSPELPGTMNIRIRHPNFVEAVRIFSPGFGNAGGTARPVDLAGTAKIAGSVYEFSDLKGTLGASDIAGAVKADLSGDIPQIVADINSNRLDAGALVGVDSRAAGTKSAASGPATAQSAATPVGGSHWSREALDTGFLHTIGLDIKVAAKTLAYGTWTLTDAKAGVVLKNGALKVSPLSGGLYGGTLDAGIDASSKGDKTPLEVAFRGDVKDVSVGPFLQALTSSPAKKADGKGSLSFNVKGAGISSAALMASLTGEAKVAAQTLTVYGMDIDKFAANMVEAFDGGWKGVIAGAMTQGLATGDTQFKDVEHSFPISGGNMPVKNFTMETTSGNATLVANGNVNFGAWYMDIGSEVKVTQPKDVPVIGIHLAGPLNAPRKTINSQALDNLIRSKIGDQLQDVIGEQLEGTKAGETLNQLLPGLLGGGRQAPSGATAPAPATPESAAPAPAPAQETAPAPSPEPEAQPQSQGQEPKPIEQQLFEGFVNQLAR